MAESHITEPRMLARAVYSLWSILYAPLLYTNLRPSPQHTYRCIPAKKKFREDDSCHKSPPSTKDFREMAKEVMLKIVQEVWKHLGNSKAFTHNCTVTRSQKRKLGGRSIGRWSMRHWRGHWFKPKHNPEVLKNLGQGHCFNTLLHTVQHLTKLERGSDLFVQIFKEKQFPTFLSHVT